MIGAHPEGTECISQASVLEQVAARAGRHAALLVDWDGCLAISNRLHPAAISFLQNYQDRVAIVSNNSTHLPEDFCRLLARAGVRVPAHRVILAGSEAISLAAQKGASRAMVLGARKMVADAARRGLPVHSTGADLIVLLRDTQINYKKLERAANALAAGARLIVANPDRTHPGENGQIVPETGALLAALKTCLGAEPVDMQMVGKPGPHLFQRACEALRTRPQDALMIGDNPDTDIAGAHSLGMEAVLFRPPIDYFQRKHGHARSKSLD